MPTYGYFLSSEEHAPFGLVDQAVRAEQSGFEALWISDHYHPWNDEQGQSPFVWTVLGAIAARTERVRCYTAVTAPTVRIHPAVIAQAAATVQVMFDGRFGLGVGTGEALNEHIFGDAWPSAEVRLEMLEEAVQVLRALWSGNVVRHRGRHYTVDTAQIYTLPEQGVPVLVSGFGPKATELAARIGDGYMNTAPAKDMVQLYRSSGGTGPTQAGVKVCWAADAEDAKKTVHRLWPNQAIPGEAAQVLPSPKHFMQVSELVTPEAAVEGLAHGPDVGAYVESVKQYVDAGFDEIFLSQIGPDQEGFFRFWDTELRDALKDL
ncbi:MAG: TIGR03557 family F420-dependent LLM class oxidoreductase [Actinobacteria bacterium]|nr:TIGR03557 family F420-dependent LLM class oxidoreductase [Actinomycetota bacterium]MCA1719705.1 TIGR03557 family F420-dependent LLM class oxidoreductase [Actinomycetota bacterium]